MTLSWILTYFDNIIIERLFLAIHLVDMEKFAQMFNPDSTPKLQELQKGISFGLLACYVSTLSILTPSKVAIFDVPTAAI